MQPDLRPSRRKFIRDAATLGAAAYSADWLLGQDATSKPADSKPAESLPSYKNVRLAYIGTGGIGGHHFEETTKLGVSCLCFCDVDSTRFDNGFKHFPRAKAYQDYRAMFDNEHKNIDGVMIGTPDHHHFPATMIAMQLGKAVYTQKPLTHTPWEARKLLEASKKYKVVTQMGNQGHALEGWRLVYEWVRSGALGDIKEVHSWTDRPIWPQGMGRPEGSDDVPGSLNWDAWLGPAPERPYKAKVYHHFNWRGWWDFGAGALGDMACHTMDGIFWALDPGYPTSIEPIVSTPMNNESFPKAAAVKWTFAAKEGRPAFDCYWYDGGLMPKLPQDLEVGRKLPPTGNLFIGTKASMLVSGDYGESPRIIPEAKMKEIGKPKQLLERSPGHQREWLMAIAGEKPIDFPKSNFAYAAPFTESILLGNVALRVGRRLEYDGANMKVTNVAEANQFLTKEYRAGWKFDV
ncbi:MAG: Gfo/Idh/MocA family protein [Phycisphaerae bacterium]